jgi:hypothetical protein
VEIVDSEFSVECLAALRHFLPILLLSFHQPKLLPGRSVPDTGLFGGRSVLTQGLLIGCTIDCTLVCLLYRLRLIGSLLEFLLELVGCGGVITGDLRSLASLWWSATFLGRCSFGFWNSRSTILRCLGWASSSSFLDIYW